MKDAQQVIDSLRRDKAELAEFAELLLARLVQVDTERTVAAFVTRPPCVYELMRAMFPEHTPKVAPPPVVSMRPAEIGE